MVPPDLYQPPRHTEQLSQLESQIKGLGHARHNIATEVRRKNALQIGFIPSNDERKKKKNKVQAEISDVVSSGFIYWTYKEQMQHI